MSASVWATSGVGHAQPVPASVGAWSLTYPDGHRALTTDEALAVGDLRARGCRVLTLGRAEREALDGALRHVWGALSDPTVRALLAAKDDLQLESDAGWTTDAGAGMAALRALESLPAVSVMSFDDGPTSGERGGCDEVGGGAMNAFVWPGMPVVLVYRPHLLRLSQLASEPGSPEAEAATRTLARTLVHELAHTVGYTHPDDAHDARSARYHDSVPAYLGCVAEAYPDIDRARGSCGHVDVADCGHVTSEGTRAGPCR